MADPDESRPPTPPTDQEELDGSEYTAVVKEVPPVMERSTRKAQRRLEELGRLRNASTQERQQAGKTALRAETDVQLTASGVTDQALAATDASPALSALP